MNSPFNNSLSKSLFINTSIVLLLLLISLAGSFLWLERLDYQRNIENFETEFMQKNRDLVKNEIKDVLKYVQFRDDGLLTRTRNQVKTRVENVYTILEYVYERMPPSSSKKEIITEIVKTIKPLNFNNSEQYIFINSLDGRSILYPPDPGMENTNLLETSDNQNIKVMQHLIEIAKTELEGFATYEWPHPEKETGLYKKLAYIKTFEPLGIFIGSGEYLIHMKEEVQTETLNWISKLRFGNDGYIFVLDSEGYMLSHVDPEYDESSLLDYRDPEGLPVIKKILRVAQTQDDGGFLQYLWRKPSDGTQASKISFVQYYKSWDWVFGAGVYLDTLQKQIDVQLAQYKTRMWTRIWISLGIFFCIAVLSVALVLFMSKKVERSLHLFADFFQNAITNYTLINPASLKYKEFRKIADYANTMVSEYKDAQKSMQYSLKEKETLLKEVHHRVKNNLQLISSILNLQSSHLKDEALLQYFKESQSRIFTIASVHEELYESENFSKVDLKAYINRIVPDLVHLYSNSAFISYDIEVDSVFVELSTAIPLGLILNEVITNSIQHAFPAYEKGFISVRCKKTDKNIAVTVKDDGIGIPDTVQRSYPDTLGIQLIDTLAAQIKSTYTIKNESGGKGSIVSIYIPTE